MASQCPHSMAAFDLVALPRDSELQDLESAPNSFPEPGPKLRGRQKLHLLQLGLHAQGF